MALCLYDGGAEVNRKHFQNDLDNPKDIESESFEEIKLSKKNWKKTTHNKLMEQTFRPLNS